MDTVYKRNILEKYKTQTQSINRGQYVLMKQAKNQFRVRGRGRNRADKFLRLSRGRRGEFVRGKNSMRLYLTSQ